MNLDQWNSLSSRERDERRKRWIPRVSAGVDPMPEEVEWQGLVSEAEKRFAAQYGDHPEILMIASSAWFDDRHPVAITVRTRLSEGQHLRDLPGEFLSFQVNQEPVGDDVEAFKRTWTVVLTELFGWSDDAIQDWIAGHERVFRSVWFLHDAPLQDIPMRDLAQPILGQRSDWDVIGIEQELERAIGINFYADEEADYDWDMARKRIASVLDKYRLNREVDRH
jgi:hypothetical protein